MPHTPADRPPAASALERLRLKRPPRRILLLRPSALGDVGRTVPALVSIRRAFPAAEIDWLVNRAFAPAIASHPDLDRVVPFDRERPSATLGLIRRLRARRYDLAFDLQGLARTGLLMAASGAKVRVTDRAAREGAWAAGNRRIRLEPRAHAVDRLLALLEGCGIEPLADLRLYVSSPDREAATASQSTAGIVGSFLAVAPTARWGCKRWPIERFAAVSAQVARGGRPVVGLFGPADGGARAAFEAAVRGGSSPAPVVAVEPAGVGELMAHLEAAAGLLGNDSAALHLAVGLGTPTVSLFGPTDPAAVGPFLGGTPAARHEVIQPDGPPTNAAYRRLKDDDAMMRVIGEAEVLEAVHRLVSGGPGAGG